MNRISFHSSALACASWLVIAAVLSLLPVTIPAVSAAGLEDLPAVSAVVSDTLRLPFTGVRGIAWRGSRLYAVVTKYDGLSAPDSPFEAEFLSYHPETGDVKVLAQERDAYGAGLVHDGEYFWSGGSLLGERQGLYSIFPPTGEVDTVLPAPGYHPAGLAWDGSYLWQVDADARKLYRIEIEEGKVSRKVSAPAFYPTGLAYDGFHFWCADASTGRLYRLKGYNGRADAVVAREAFYRPGEFVSLTWDGRGLWVVGAADSRAVRLEILR